jgi:hypothetical protein
MPTPAAKPQADVLRAYPAAGMMEYPVSKAVSGPAKLLPRMVESVGTASD